MPRQHPKSSKLPFTDSLIPFYVPSLDRGVWLRAAHPMYDQGAVRCKSSSNSAP
ncbi:hypothetical protein PanWU01x14_017710 [Parasponia andersonii]|uniref:Uncharacterized protein n=1 Tax=Parasponia andersonii TaxID=3476 RepID=A0A2P5DYZ6_PARAD|nr:hypothetical protein PanWU01x14_017710 [Parasponia andersonii]